MYALRRYIQRGVERALAPLEIPTTCGSTTCGVDVDIVAADPATAPPPSEWRLLGAEVDASHDRACCFEVHIMELNARTTMSHYGMAAKRRFGRSARRFKVIQLAELAELRRKARLTIQSQDSRHEEGGTLAFEYAIDDSINECERIVCLTDPKTASMFCAVLVCSIATQS